MSRILIPLTAVLLVLIAIAGVVMGVRVQMSGEAEEAAPREEQRDGQRPWVEDPALPEADAEPGTGAASGDPASLIRFGVPTPPAKREGAVRIATYNVENLFDAIDDPALTGRYEDIDDAKPESALAGVAAAIRSLDADILALQEIEAEAVIRWFRDSHLQGLGYDHLASIDAGDERGIEQAVLSRFPITEIKNWPGKNLAGIHPDNWGDAENFNAGTPIRFHRSPLRVTVEVPPSDGAVPYELTMYVVHHKSGRPGDYWREAEAFGLVELLEEAGSDPEHNIVILGDFNAYLTDQSVQTIVSAGFTDALGDVYIRGPQFTTHESGRRIDHILVNAALAPELVPGSGFVLGTPALPEGADWRDPWRPEGYASDHYPVAVDLVPVEAANAD